MAILPDHKCRRKPSDGELARKLLVFVERDRQTDSQLIKKLSDALRIHVRRDCHDANTSRIKVLLQPAERWHFLFAWAAPSGPEIQDEKLAPKVVPAEGLSSFGDDLESWRLVADVDETLAHRIRQHESQQGRKRRCPIIAMTANALPEDRERCLPAGMDDHMSKPVTRAQLETMLAKWVGSIPSSSSA